jgi:hypothetical protein
MERGAWSVVTRLVRILWYGNPGTKERCCLSNTKNGAERVRRSEVRRGQSASRRRQSASHSMRSRRRASGGCP